MASVNLNALTEVQNPASTDNLLLFNETSNVATRIDYDKLAEAILNKTRNEIGGVSPISAIATLNSSLSSLYCRDYSYASGTSYKDAVTDVISKLENTIARYWVIITIGASRLSLMIIKDGKQWSNGILTSYGSTTTDVYFVMSRAGQAGETIVYLRKLLTGDLE